MTSENQRAQQHLWQKWTERLYEEYERILYQYRIPARRSSGPPLIKIESMQSKWGSWDPLLRSITLSDRLLTQHPWDIVLGVLKHEMAHQLVTEMYRGDHTHGPLFKQACAQLGVPDWAIRATGDLPECIEPWQARSMTEEEEKLLKRVEKLLSLATSSSENEALLAMQRVQELYARYNIERLREAANDQFVYLIINQRQRRIPQTESMIFSILNEYFFVRCIYSDQFDAQDLVEYKVVELLGRRENVMMAEYVYHFLRNRLNCLWQTYKRQHHCAGNLRTSYQIGVLSGFRGKLQQQQAHGQVTTSDGKIYSSKEAAALVQRQDAALTAFIGLRFPRLVSRSRGARRHDATSFRAGQADGQRIVLSRPIHEKTSLQGLLLKG